MKSSLRWMTNGEAAAEQRDGFEPTIVRRAPAFGPCELVAQFGPDGKRTSAILALVIEARAHVYDLHDHLRIVSVGTGKEFEVSSEGWKRVGWWWGRTERDELAIRILTVPNHAHKAQVCRRVGAAVVRRPDYHGDRAPKKFITKCEWCGVRFTTSDHTKRFCTHRHAQMARNARRKA